MKKNEKYRVQIIDQGFEGEGIAKIENETVFIEGALKGETVEIQIVKVLSHFAYGKLIHIIEPAKERTEVDCDSYQRCGGCSLRHINYEATLALKRDIVQNCFYKAIHQEVAVEPCIGMKNPVGYRNKLIYPVGENKEGKTIMGVFAKRSHEIIETKRCYLQDEKNEQIAKDVLDFLRKEQIAPYNEERQTGLVRHIMVRSGKKTGERMVILVVREKEVPKEQQLVEILTKQYPEIKTIVKNINEKNTNVILGEKNVVLYGEGYIYDELGNYRFKLSPFSFYQVNPVQTEVLYQKAIEYAELTGKETIFDLYCGIGTIGIFASKKAKKVYGIEVVEQAIEDAKENATLNQINNAEFMVGEVEKQLPELVKRQEADVVFLDPPRKGCDKRALDTLLAVEPKKIVYISCNPATLARDVALLEEKYTLGKVQPVDMFPFTAHVECVAVLQLKQDR